MKISILAVKSLPRKFLIQLFQQKIVRIFLKILNMPFGLPLLEELNMHVTLQMLEAPLPPQNMSNNKSDYSLKANLISKISELSKGNNLSNLA